MSGIFQIAFAGLSDGVNPGGFTALLLFCLIFYLCVRRQWPIRTIVTVSFLSFFSGLAVFIYGLLDIYRWQPLYENVMDALSVGNACLFVLIGLLCFRDWVVYKLEGDQRKLIIKFDFQDGLPADRKRLSFWMWLIFAFFSWWCGFLLSVIAADWPANELVQVIYIYQRLKTFSATSMGLCLIYGAFFLIPLLIVTQVFKLFFKKHLWGKKGLISVLRMVLSALYLSHGLSLMYFYFF